MLNLKFEDQSLAEENIKGFFHFLQGLVVQGHHGLYRHYVRGNSTYSFDPVHDCFLREEDLGGYRPGSFCVSTKITNEEEEELIQEAGLGLVDILQVHRFDQSTERVWWSKCNIKPREAGYLREIF